MCHGSGGLTAHYRLGGRTPASTALIGVLLIVVALLFGWSAQEVRSLMPYAVLGALLMYVGVQHMQLGLKVKGIQHFAVVALVGAVAATPYGNLAIGAGVGLAAYWGATWVAALVGRQKRLADDPRQG
jgi:MFS superfamily sulfate permease-like transporter